jgi:hypothetical protein
MAKSGGTERFFPTHVVASKMSRVCNDGDRGAITVIAADRNS